MHIMHFNQLYLQSFLPSPPPLFLPNFMGFVFQPTEPTQCCCLGMCAGSSTGECIAFPGTHSWEHPTFPVPGPSIASNSSARGWTLSDHTHTYMLRFWADLILHGLWTWHHRCCELVWAMALSCPANTNTISLQMPMISSSCREIMRYILVSIPVAVVPLQKVEGFILAPSSRVRLFGVHGSPSLKHLITLHPHSEGRLANAWSFLDPFPTHIAQIPGRECTTHSGVSSYS